MFGILRQRVKSETKCTVRNFLKNDAGLLCPHEFVDSQVGFKENSNSRQRIYYFYYASEYVECQLISSNHNPAFVGSYVFGGCDLSLLNLKRSRKTKKLPGNEIDSVISDFIVILIAVIVSLWLASRWFYSLPSSFVEPV